MKRYLLLSGCVILLGLQNAVAAELASGFGDNRYNLSVMAEYSYNYTWRSMGNIDVLSTVPINKNFEVQAQMQYSSANVFTMAATMRPKFPLKVGEIFIDTEILYKAVIRNRQHDASVAISLGYRFDYLSFQFGWHGRVMTPFNIDWQSQETHMVEPFNILYRIEVFCRPQACNWNISASLADFDEFQIERMHQPIFTLGGRYDINNNWRVMLTAQCKPTGMFHLTASFYSATVRAGFTYKF